VNPGQWSMYEELPWPLALGPRDIS
jgi:hypothetical protein